MGGDDLGVVNAISVGSRVLGQAARSTWTQIVDFSTCGVEYWDGNIGRRPPGQSSPCPCICDTPDS
eukprot:scaffold25335_cov109-Skeletonema_dohrnii-CCMP3373.AAC.3